MTRYSIKDLENFTEIKAHTIRIWEQRYNLFSPQRTESNIRYYSQSDLKKILNINLLYCNGIKISKIAKLSEEEISKKARDLIIDNSESGSEEVDRLLIAITEMDSAFIRELLWNYDSKIEFRQLYHKVLMPLLIKMGKLWQTSAISVAHEHLFSNILRDYFAVKINSLKPEKINGKTAILFLPEHEEHELSLMYFHYLLKEAGFNCIYLGKNVPLSDVVNTIDFAKPDVLVTNLITRIEIQEMNDIFHALRTNYPKLTIRAAGSFLLEIKNTLPKEIEIINSESVLIR